MNNGTWRERDTGMIRLGAPNWLWRGAANGAGLATGRQAAGPVPAVATDARPLRALVVDDNQAIRALVEATLAGAGYAVAAAEDGAAALTAVEEWLPDVIVLDVQMPVLDGEGFVAAYRRTLGPHVPIIVISAALDGRRRAAGMGAAGYLDKPFSPRALVAMLSAVLRLPVRQGD